LHLSLLLLPRPPRHTLFPYTTLFRSSEKRLARLLLLLANFGKEGKQEAVIPKVSQETLAEMIGTTRSRVSFFMNKFRRLGFIERSEEHTSELQSRRDLVCRLLLEKKK